MDRNQKCRNWGFFFFKLQPEQKGYCNKGKENRGWGGEKQAWRDHSGEVPRPSFPFTGLSFLPLSSETCGPGKIWFISGLSLPIWRWGTRPADPQGPSQPGQSLALSSLPGGRRAGGLFLSSLDVDSLALSWESSVRKWVLLPSASVSMTVSGQPPPHPCGCSHQVHLLNPVNTLRPFLACPLVCLGLG